MLHVLSHVNNETLHCLPPAEARPLLTERLDVDRSVLYTEDLKIDEELRLTEQDFFFLTLRQPMG